MALLRAAYVLANRSLALSIFDCVRLRPADVNDALADGCSHEEPPAAGAATGPGAAVQSGASDLRVRRPAAGDPAAVVLGDPPHDARRGPAGGLFQWIAGHRRAGL
jgi:hypothetical protein